MIEVLTKSALKNSVNEETGAFPTLPLSFFVIMVREQTYFAKYSLIKSIRFLLMGNFTSHHTLLSYKNINTYIVIHYSKHSIHQTSYLAYSNSLLPSSLLRIYLKEMSGTYFLKSPYASKQSRSQLRFPVIRVETV